MFKKGVKHPVAKKGAKKTVHRAKAKVFVFKPSIGEDFKPFFIEAKMGFGKDGLLRDVRSTRVKGRPDTDSAKRIPQEILDPKTASRFATRLAGPMFIRKEANRIPPFSYATAVLRVGLKVATGGIAVSFKSIKLRAGKEGKLKLLLKKNPYYRAIRKANKFLPGAFTEAVAFPTNKELKVLLEGAGKADE
jgi:hypothetical protein